MPFVFMLAINSLIDRSILNQNNASGKQRVKNKRKCYDILSVDSNESHKGKFGGNEYYNSIFGRSIKEASSREVNHSAKSLKSSNDKKEISQSEFGINDETICHFRSTNNFLEEMRQKQAIGSLENKEAANHAKGKLKRPKGVAWRAQIRKRIKCNRKRNQKFSKYTNSNEYFMRENTISKSVFAKKKKWLNPNQFYLWKQLEDSVLEDKHLQKIRNERKNKKKNEHIYENNNILKQECNPTII